MNGVEWWKMVWWCLGWMGGSARSVLGSEYMENGEGCMR